MTLPFLNNMPDWLPWWVPLLLLVPALLYVLALLFMPFSVIGVKGRLDVIEARLDEIQGEIRSLALRLREPGAVDYRGADFEEVYAPGQSAPVRAGPQVPSRPPIPPAAHELEEPAPRRVAQSWQDRSQRREPAPTPRAASRSEPHIDWPR
jgi:hypothetical protein